jgi:hypothetical protein
MKRKEKIIFVLAMFSAIVSQGAFDQFGKEARFSAMGEAAVAAADDASALFHNPAGLTRLNGIAVAGQMSRLAQGFDDDSTVSVNSLSAAFSLREGKYGAAGFSYSDYKATSLAQERLLAAGYAARLSDWSMGATVKYLRRDLSPHAHFQNAFDDDGLATSEADPLMARHGLSKDVISADIGALYQYGLGRRSYLGVAVTNVNKPSVSLAENGDHLPRTIRLGYAYKPSWGVVSLEVRNNADAMIGLERNISLSNASRVSLRGGYFHGDDDLRTLSAGFAIQWSFLQMDYAFGLPVGLLTEAGAMHRVGFSYMWAAPSPKPALTRLMESMNSAQAPADWENFKKEVLVNVRNDEDKAYAHAALEYWRAGNYIYANRMLEFLSTNAQGNQH